MFFYTSGGGICKENKGTIEDCINEGEITLRPTYDTSIKVISCGGISGLSSGKILNCKNLGNISGSGNYSSTDYNADNYVGGICGSAMGSIVNSANLGNISYFRRMSGICGGTYYKKKDTISDGTETDLYILNCFNNGVFKDNASTKREATFIGAASKGNVYIKNCYTFSSEYYPLLARFDESYDSSATTIKIENCYGKGATVFYEANYNDNNKITFTNVYTSRNNSSNASGTTYVTEAEMKTEEFCKRINNNQISDSGEPIFKMIKEQEYPALYWQEGTPK